MRSRAEAALCLLLLVLLGAALNGGRRMQAQPSGEAVERRDRAEVGGLGRGVVRSCWVDCV